MSQPKTAMDHLGFLLHLLSDLHPGERSDAFNDTLTFYNDANPEHKIERRGVGWTYLQHLFHWEEPAVFHPDTQEYYIAFPSDIMKKCEEEFLAAESRDASGQSAE